MSELPEDRARALIERCEKYQEKKMEAYYACGSDSANYQHIELVLQVAQFILDGPSLVDDPLEDTGA